MEYVKTAAPVMVQVFGPEDAGYLLHLTGKLIGMQYFDEIAARASARNAAARRSSSDFLRVLFDCAGRCRLRSASPKAVSNSGSRAGS